MKTDLKFRYDTDNINSMASQMKHEFGGVLQYEREWIKSFIKSKMPRTYPFSQSRVITTKRGNKWHLELCANSDDDLHDIAHAAGISYMDYDSKYGKGIIVCQWFNGHDVYFDFTPHAIERYRQRYLVERNINVTKDEQISMMMRSMFTHNLNIDHDLAILITEQGAFHGDYIGNVWMQFKTFIGYENAFRNQRKVLDFVRRDIARKKEEIANGKAYNVATREERIMSDTDIHKRVTKDMIKKSGMYHDFAHKRNEEYYSKKAK